MALIRRGEEREREEFLPEPFRTWDPFRTMREMLRWDPFREMERIFAPWRPRTFSPDFDVKETADAYVFRADLPGVKEEDLDISVTGNRITVSGRRQEEDRQEGENYYTYERAYGAFRRSFTLPSDVDAENAKAQLQNGVLTITIPKTPEAKPKKIPIGGERKQIKA